MQQMSLGPPNASNTSISAETVAEARTDTKRRRVARSTLARFHEEQLESSVWFTRAWTLQELLAPVELRFYNEQFHEIGTRSELSAIIASATGIDRKYLAEMSHQGRRSVTKASVAERMKWASRRQATREEDIAYSLLGIFDVNMSLLYGEGKRAFSRLQSEILKHSDDESIFVWVDNRVGVTTTGLLAPSIRHFADVELPILRGPLNDQYDYHETNKGVKFTVRLPSQELDTTLAGKCVATICIPLNCYTYRHRDLRPDLWVIEICILAPHGSERVIQWRDNVVLTGYRKAISCETTDRAREETRSDRRRPVEQAIMPRSNGTVHTIYFPNEPHRRDTRDPLVLTAKRAGRSKAL